MTTTPATEAFIRTVNGICEAYPDLVNPSHMGSCLYVKESYGMWSDDGPQADHCLIGTYLVENTGIDDETLSQYEDTSAGEVLRELGFEEVVSEVAGIYQAIADRQIPWGEVPKQARLQVSNYLNSIG
jgi:hypothetical protein